MCELLDEIGRLDLSALVKDYVQKKSSECGTYKWDHGALDFIIAANSLAPVHVTDKLEFKHLKLISEEVGRDWKMLGRHLNLDEATLDTIQQAHFSDMKEASYQALLR